MTTETPDTAATLEQIRERSDRPIPHVGSLPISHDGVRSLMESAADVPCLLAAVGAVLKLHVPVGEMGVDELWCGECSVTERLVPWRCPTYLAISRALTGEEPSDG